jgi:hypothetical protein
MGTYYITIIDNTGRNIIGVLENETDTTIDIKNPVMITVQPQNGQFSVQLIPLFLAEFIAHGSDARNFYFTFNKSNIAIGKNFSVDARITTQYDKIIEVTNAAKPAVVEKSEPEVVKLFEE